MESTRHGPPDAPGKAGWLARRCPSTRALLLCRRAAPRLPLPPEIFRQGSAAEFRPIASSCLAVLSPPAQAPRPSTRGYAALLMLRECTLLRSTGVDERASTGNKSGIGLMEPRR